jgi:hypothetical protein
VDDRLFAHAHRLPAPLCARITLAARPRVKPGCAKPSKTLLFLKKKKQKDFIHLRGNLSGKYGWNEAPGHESFLVLFFKKEPLA